MSKDPANGTTVQRPSKVTATYDTTLDPRSDQSFITITHAGGATVDGMSSTAAPGTVGNTITWTPTSASDLTDGAYNAFARAKAASPSDPPVTTNWSFTIDNTPPALDSTKVSYPKQITPANQTSVHVIGAV